MSSEELPERTSTYRRAEAVEEMGLPRGRGRGKGGGDGNQARLNKSACQNRAKAAV